MTLHITGTLSRPVKEHFDILNGICGKLVGGLTPVNASIRPEDMLEPIRCIEYLATNTNFSLRQSIEHSNSTLIQRLVSRKCYVIIDELLKWCFGYSVT